MRYPSTTTEALAEAIRQVDKLPATRVDHVYQAGKGKRSKGTIEHNPDEETIAEACRILREAKEAEGVLDPLGKSTPMTPRQSPYEYHVATLFGELVLEPLG